MKEYIISIQDRLLVQRYSTMNLRTPTTEELEDSGLHNIRFPIVSKAKLKELSYLLKNPPKKDRYYSGYATLITDFFDEVDKSVASRGSSRVLSQLYNQQLTRKLAHFVNQPTLYGNSFPHYGITWMFNLLMSMRSFVMRQRIERGEMSPVWNKCRPESNGYYKLPKPMGNKAMSELAANIYDLVYSDCMRYLNKI